MSGIEIAAYVIGLFTTLAAILAMQFKSMRFVVLFQLIANVLLGVQYTLEGAFSAAITVPFAIALSLISLAFAVKDKKIPKFVVALFLVVFTVLVAVTFVGPQDLLALGALYFFVLSITREKSYQSRMCTALNSGFWLVYDIILAPSAIITHGVLLLFTVAGIIRLDRKEWGKIFKKAKE